MMNRLMCGVCVVIVLLAIGTPMLVVSLKTAPRPKSWASGAWEAEESNGSPRKVRLTASREQLVGTIQLPSGVDGIDAVLEVRTVQVNEGRIVLSLECPPALVANAHRGQQRVEPLTYWLEMKNIEPEVAEVRWVVPPPWLVSPPPGVKPVIREFDPKQKPSARVRRTGASK
jgi:hypothetical protein